MNNEKKIKIVTGMVAEMLELAKAVDERHKARMLTKGQGEQSLGESWVIFHLKAIKELLEDESV